MYVCIFISSDVTSILHSILYSFLLLLFYFKLCFSCKQSSDLNGFCFSYLLTSNLPRLSKDFVENDMMNI